jgi:serine protease Do
MDCATQWLRRANHLKSSAAAASAAAAACSLLIAVATAAAVAAAPPPSSAFPAATSASSAASGAPPTAETIQQVVDLVRPSLVRIHVVEDDPEDGRESKQEAFGSGVIISPDGYVVTNHHVAGKARWISCTLADKEEVRAKLIGSDPLADIALIKLDPPPGGGNYPVAKWGDSAQLHVGDPVLAMGSPLAFSQSVTSGIVSNTELILPRMEGDLTLDGEDVGSIVRWIGHSAQILPGNSGGPLVDLSGAIVGINEISVGLAGAIPSNIAHSVVEQLRKQGHVTRAYFGMDLQPLLRTGAAAPSGVGALVGGVLPGSPAALAGVEPGDILISAAGAPVDARFPEQIPMLNLQITNLPVGEPAALVVRRDGQQLTLTATPRERTPAEAPSVEAKGWGMTVSDITPTEIREERYPADVTGVLVTGVLEGGPATEAHPAIEEGDLLLSIGSKPLAGVHDLLARSETIPASDSGTPTLVEVWRNAQRLLTVVGVNKQANDDAAVTVAKAWLPLEVQVVTQELATALGLPDGTTGVRVTQVYPVNMTASDTSTPFPIHVGDVLTRIDDLPIEASQPEDTDVFAALVRQYHIGAEAKIHLYRDGKPDTVTVTLTRGPKEERELPRYTDDEFGLAIRSVSYKDRADQDAGPNEDGALVVSVTRGSWASLAGLEEGDIIHAISGTPVADMQAARARLTALKAERPKSVLFFVARGIHTLYVEVLTDYALDARTASDGVRSSQPEPPHVATSAKTPD